MRARLALLALVSACGDPAAHVQLAPVPLPGGCGLTTNKSGLRVTAFTPGGQVKRTVPPTEIDAFPADTEQLGVEVVGGSGGGLLAVGKTAPLDYGDLADGTEIPILMVPPNGFCPVGALTEPRVAPVVARAGAGVLVVGGTGAAGEPLSSAEWFDPAAATFTAVDVPPSLVDPANGLSGAALTELPDGRVVLSGTASHALTIFDPATRSFSMPALFDHRAFHASIASDADHLFVIGGCADVVNGACSGPVLRTGFQYELANLANRMRGPTLADSANRIGAHIEKIGVGASGDNDYVLLGGTGDPGVADRFTLAADTATTISGLHAQNVLLDGGAILGAFDPDGTVQSGTASLAPPGSDTAVPLQLAPRLDGARLVVLEDGSVLAIGGDPAAKVTRYLPTTDTWSALTPAGSPPGPLDAPVLIRLLDGNVLVLGARTPSAEAWIYRPSLVGATSGSVAALADASTEGVLVVPDPTAATRQPATLTLESVADDLHARVLVGGPKIATGQVTAAVTVKSGGVALLGRQTGPGDVLVGRLVPGEPARIQALHGTALTTLCTGRDVTASDIATLVTLSITGATATLVTPTASLVSCEVPAGDRGTWGVAAAGANSRIEVGAVTVERAR